MVADAIDALLRPEAAQLIDEYYDADGPFAGASFESIGANDETRIGTDDLLALTFLDVAVHPRGVRQILGSRAEEIHAHLSDIASEVPLWEADDGLLDRAGALWSLLCEVPSIDAVKAGKLLARKRPHLIPVVDKWVQTALAAPAGSYWKSIRAALQDP